MKNLNLHKYPQVYNCICYLPVQVHHQYRHENLEIGGGGGRDIRFIRIVTKIGGSKIVDASYIRDQVQWRAAGCFPIHCYEPWLIVARNFLP